LGRLAVLGWAGASRRDGDVGWPEQTPQTFDRETEDGLRRAGAGPRREAWTPSRR